MYNIDGIKITVEAVTNMAREQRTSEDIIADAMNELRAAVEKFANTLSQHTTDVSSFLTMDKLENMMGLLDEQTRQVYLDMVSRYLSNINEQEIIASKKENTKKRE